MTAAAAGDAVQFSMPSDREVLVTKVFDAPRDLVWKAYTDPKLIPKWWGPRYLTTIVDKMDVRPGGEWRYVPRSPDGKELGFHGAFQEVVRPDRIVWTFEFEGMPGHVSVETVTLEEEGNKTKVTVIAKFQNKADRDGMVTSGMESGQRESMERLDVLLQEMGEMTRPEETIGRYVIEKKGAYATLNGLEMYYEVNGVGDPLLLLNGGAGATGMFDPILTALAASHRVIAVDLQAHGRTADIERPLRYELMAEDIAALIKYLGIEQADIMGYSLGGGVALRTAIQHPGSVRKLVVVSAAFKRDGWYPEVLAAMAQSGPESAAMMKQSPMYQLYSAIAPRPEDWPVPFTKLGDLLRRDYDWSKEVATLEVPTMLVFGDADSISPSHAAEFFALLGGGKRDAGWDGSRRPSSRLAVVPGTTHYNSFSSPALPGLVLDFLGDATMAKERTP